jgi:hypothetical protein
MTRYVSPDFLPFGQKNSSFGQNKEQNSTSEKKTVEIGERRDRGCIFFRMIEMIAQRNELTSPPFASSTPPLS